MSCCVGCHGYSGSVGETAGDDYDVSDSTWVDDDDNSLTTEFICVGVFYDLHAPFNMSYGRLMVTTPWVKKKQDTKI